MNRKKLVFSIIAFFGLYLFSTGISYAIFTYLVAPPMLRPVEEVGEAPEEVLPGGMRKLLDATGPKTEACPLNGQKFTKAEKKAWEKRRPLLVMIENHQESRPQSGLSFADITYEAVAEGGITRLMAIYYCDAQAQEVIVGPIRSARTYFLDWASEYGGYPLYVHVGGANTPGPANALGQIEEYGWGGIEGNDINQFSVGFPTFWRDYERLGHTVATEHTMYSTTERLWAVAKERGWTAESPDGDDWTDSFVSWKFEESAGDDETAGIAYSFWEDYGDYAVRWEYDKATNEYKRFNGGQPHKDLDNDQQLTAKNVIVIFTKESTANDGYPGDIHLLYGTTGEGEALVFKNGKAVEGTWEKDSRLGRMKIFDEKGKEIGFVEGKIWISNLPAGAKLDY